MKARSFLLILFFTSFISVQSSDPRKFKSILFKDNEKTVVCFVYHRFGDKRYPTTNVPLADFENHLRYLKDNKFQMLTLSEAMRYLNSNGPVQKTAVITVDDGYKSFFVNGLSLLKKYEMPATLFINTKTIGASDFMDWNQLKAVNEANVEIGNHTHSHNFFLNEAVATRYESFKSEIERSQNLIRENLNLTPRVFTYPYGEFDTRMKEIVKEAGFVCASAQNSGVWYKGTDPFQIPRFPMSESYSGIKQFVEKSKMKPFEISKESPINTLLTGAESKPLLTLTINANDLQVKTIKCFVQGSNCTWDIGEQNQSALTVKIKPASSILNRRRTLYTITAMDKSGIWHWYSHLWINPEIKVE